MARLLGITGSLLLLLSVLFAPLGEREPQAARTQALLGPQSTATRVAEVAEIATLRAQVSALQTEVARLTTPSDPALGGQDCGEPVTGWGAPTAGGVRGDLRSFAALAPLIFPPVDQTAIAELALTNVGSAPVIVRLADFALVTCDGERVAPDAAASTLVSATELGSEREMAAGEAIEGNLSFILPHDAVALVLEYRITTPDGVCGGQLRFPLITAPPPKPRECAGGTADAGTSTGGSSGGAGGDAVGGNAIGGDGGDGASVNTDLGPFATATPG